MDKTSIILKSDARGRVRTPPERREALVAEFERSGLPATKFSALVGVRYQTFATWVQRRRQLQQRSSSGRKRQGKAVRFVQAVVEASEPAADPVLRLVLGGGAAHLELSEVAQVPLAVQLIQGLAKPC